MDRDELLQREARAWDALEAAVARVPDDRRAEEGVVPGWSTKDLVWHCGYWAGWAGGKSRGDGRRHVRRRIAR